MQPSSKTASVVRFGIFEADMRSGELRKNGVKIKLQEQPFQVLVALLERPGEVVTRKDLQQRLWSDDTFVDFEHSLGTAIKKIRQALDDSANNPRFVETLPKRGYRFIAPVDPRAAATGPLTADSEAAAAGSFDVRRQHPPKLWIAAAVVLLVATSAVLISRGPETEVAIPPQAEQASQPQQVIPLTSLVGAEFVSSWSPDGKFLAFNGYQGGNFEVFVMPRTGGEPTRLTTSPADDCCARWSPDGRWLAYLSDEGVTKNVYLVPPTGGPVRKIVETGVPYMERFNDATMLLGSNPWSPDGQELLFSRLLPSGRIALWKTRLDTREETQLTVPRADHDDLQGNWAFDGKSILFVRRRAGMYGLWLLGAEDSEPQPLLADEYQNSHPAWSPDNRRVVFESDRAGAINLWEITIPSRQLRQLTTGPGSELRPVISRQEQLAYSSYHLEQNMYLRDLASGEDTPLTDDTRRSYRPRLSPDGKRVVYQSNRAGNFDLWVLDVATGEEQQVTRGPANEQGPDWSPDASRLVFFSDREGGLRVWVTRAKGGPAARLTDLVAPSRDVVGGTIVGPGPKWSPDGKLIGYLAPSEKGNALWTVDVETSSVEPVLPGVADFGWYKGSRRVVYTPAVSELQSSPVIKVLDLYTKKRRVLFTGPHSELAVAPDGSGVTFLAGPSHFKQSLRLLRLDESNGADGLPRAIGLPERLTDGGDAWHAHNGGWSWDGRSLVYVRNFLQADIYLLESYR